MNELQSELRSATERLLHGASPPPSPNRSPALQSRASGEPSGEPPPCSHRPSLFHVIISIRIISTVVASHTSHLIYTGFIPSLTPPSIAGPGNGNLLISPALPRIAPCEAPTGTAASASMFDGMDVSSDSRAARAAPAAAAPADGAPVAAAAGPAGMDMFRC